MEIDSDKNQIFLDTDNSFYFPGDTIKGNIYLIINQPILVSSLTLKIKGKEEHEKKSDWICIHCKNLNYSFRVFCNRCQIPKQ